VARPAAGGGPDPRRPADRGGPGGRGGRGHPPAVRPRGRTPHRGGGRGSPDRTVVPPRGGDGGGLVPRGRRECGGGRAPGTAGVGKPGAPVALKFVIYNEKWSRYRRRDDCFRVSS